MRRERIVIVGAGPAGVSAAVQCARLGIAPWVVERNCCAGGLIANAWRIENLAGVSPCDGPTMAERMAAHLARFDIAVERAEVRRVVVHSSGMVVTGDGGEIAAGAVILAPGTRAKTLSIPGLSLCSARVFHEVRSLLQRIPHPASATVVGGGEAALDYALSLEAAGTTVTLVMRSPRPRACPRLVDAVAMRPAITMRTEATPCSFREETSSVEMAIHAPTGVHHLTSECLLVAVGRVSRAPDLLDPRPMGLTTEILPFPGVPLFIVGDARHGSLGQLAMAFGDGVDAAGRAVAAIT